MSSSFPRTPEEIAGDYTARRAGCLRALIEEVDDFHAACDPDKENLCLYGNRNGSWSVELPAEEVPPELPEPCLGVNFARDGMQRADWLALVAVHSDAWLMAVAFFYGVKLDAAGRAQLFGLINQQPTLFEVVTGKVDGGQAAARGKAHAGAAAAAAAAAAAGAAAAANGGGTGGQQQRKQDGVMPAAYTGTGSAQGSKQPSAGMRRLAHADLGPQLVGAVAELFWPDDGLWYPVRIEQLDGATRTAKIVYLPGLECEDLEMDDIIRDGHMMLQPWQ